MNNAIRHILVVAALLVSSALAKAQQEEAPVNIGYEKALKQAQEETANGNYNQAEAAYKKAHALNPTAAGVPYNLGNLQFKKDKRFEAAADFQKAAEVATTKEEKHSIYHNMGNTFFENKQFKEAVEAYKNALRNDPTDEETRYNLALAKQEEEKQGGGGDDDQDSDKKEEGDDQDKNKEGDKDEKSDGDYKGKENEKDGKDKEGDKGDDKEGDKGDNKEGDKGDGKPKEEKGQAPQRVDGKLTPQQVKQLLEAMSNEEQKIQEKINAKKAKGKAVKSEKDW
jgi:tetratricopeptide (TPR) repeat protein